MCLKSITPIARISVCVCECASVFQRQCVCVSPKDVITMVIQKPVDYVVEKKICLIYTLPLVRDIHIQYKHKLLGSRECALLYTVFHYC